MVVVSIQTGAQKTRQLSCRLKIWSSERLLECNRCPDPQLIHQQPRALIINCGSTAVILLFQRLSPSIARHYDQISNLLRSSRSKIESECRSMDGRISPPLERNGSWDNSGEIQPPGRKNGPAQNDTRGCLLIKEKNTNPSSTHRYH